MYSSIGKCFQFQLDLKALISVMTRDVARVREIMKMIFTRLGDQRVFWHVFKSLTLLEKLITYGSPQVRLHCWQNISDIQTLLDFKLTHHHLDYGCWVRIKAQAVLDLLAEYQAAAAGAVEGDGRAIPRCEGVLGGIPLFAGLLRACCFVVPTN